jgi:radical SAM superfamily enzyme YgiQ (UPF0313 family)
MKIGFIIPPDIYNFNPFKMHPLNTMYLSTILEENFGDKIDISVIDLRGVKKEHSHYYIPQCDLFLYSVATINFPEITRIVKKIRKIYPKSKHIAGGIHIDLYPEDSLSHFDVISLGEGDNLIVSIIKDAFNKKLQRIYKEHRRNDINNYPFPNRKYLPLPSIVDRECFSGDHIDLSGTSVLFTRGCCFKCHFCANLVQSIPRVRSPSNIIKELEYLKREYGIQGVVIRDDTIISPHYETSKKTLIAIGECNIKWRGNCRANGVPLNIIKLAKQSGCVSLATGIESVYQPTLNNINKRLNIEKAKEFFVMLKEEGIGIRINLIFGLPGEPPDIVQKTIKFIEEVNPSSVFLSILIPIPGSEIFENPSKFGMKIKPNLSFDELFQIFCRYDNSEEIKMLFEYEKITPFGKSLTNNEIISNYIELQTYLRGKKLNF